MPPRWTRARCARRRNARELAHQRTRMRPASNRSAPPLVRPSLWGGHRRQNAASVSCGLQVAAENQAGIPLVRSCRYHDRMEHEPDIVSRRTLLQASAWAVPVIAVTAAAPSAAASNHGPITGTLGPPDGAERPLQIAPDRSRSLSRSTEPLWSGRGASSWCFSTRPGPTSEPLGTVTPMGSFTPTCCPVILRPWRTARVSTSTEPVTGATVSPKRGRPAPPEHWQRVHCCGRVGSQRERGDTRDKRQQGAAHSMS